MKKYLLVLATAIFAICCFTGCSDDDDDTSNEGSGIVGKWQVIQYSDPEDYDDCDYKGWINLHENGVYEEYDACDKSTTKGTWKDNGDNTIKVVAESFPVAITIKVVSVSSDKLVLEFNLFGTETITYKRI